MAILLAAIQLAGCASSTPSENGLVSKRPAEIVAAARAAAAGAATVQVTGSILDGQTPISVHMELVSRKGGQGQIMLEGLSIDVVDVDHSVYIRSDAAFYRRFAGAAAAQRLQGKWLKGSARELALGSLTSLTNLGELLAYALDAHGPLARDGATSFGGQKAIAVTDLARGGTLYVARTGTPYPLGIVKRGGRGGELVFDRWNQSITLEPPANAINIKQLQGH